jgi:hypothetical protein
MHHEEHRNLFYKFGIIDVLNCLLLQGEDFREKLKEIEKNYLSLDQNIFDEFVSVEKNVVCLISPQQQLPSHNFPIVLSNTIVNSFLSFSFSYPSIVSISLPCYPLVHFFLSLLYVSNIIILDNDIRVTVGKGFERMNALYKCGFVISLVDLSKKYFVFPKIRDNDGLDADSDSTKVAILETSFINPLYDILNSFTFSNSSSSSSSSLSLPSNNYESFEFLLLSEIFFSLSSLTANKEICTAIHQSKLTSILSLVICSSSYVLNKITPLIYSPNLTLYATDFASVSFIIPSLLLVKNSLALLKSLSHDDIIKNFFSSDNNSKTLFELVFILHICTSLRENDMKKRDKNDSSMIASLNLNTNISSSAESQSFCILNLISSIQEETAFALSSLSLRNKHLSQIFYLHYALFHPNENIESSESSSSSDFSVDPYLNYPDVVSSLLYSLQLAQLSKPSSSFISLQIHLCNTIRNIASRSSSIKQSFLFENAEKILRISLNFNQNKTPNSSESKKKSSLYEAAHGALRDLGCEVELTELWKGTGIQLKRE